MALDRLGCNVLSHCVSNRVLYELTTIETSILLREARSKECTTSTNITIQGLYILELSSLYI